MDGKNTCLLFLQIEKNLIVILICKPEWSHQYHFKVCLIIILQPVKNTDTGSL
jgi:hypothetical protein